MLVRRSLFVGSALVPIIFAACKQQQQAKLLEDGAAPAASSCTGTEEGGSSPEAARSCGESTSEGSYEFPLNDLKTAGSGLPLTGGGGKKGLGLDENDQEQPQQTGSEQGSQGSGSQGSGSQGSGSGAGGLCTGGFTQAQVDRVYGDKKSQLPGCSEPMGRFLADNSNFSDAIENQVFNGPFKAGGGETWADTRENYEKGLLETIREAEAAKKGGGASLSETDIDSELGATNETTPTDDATVSVPASVVAKADSGDKMQTAAQTAAAAWDNFAQLCDMMDFDIDLIEFCSGTGSGLSLNGNGAKVNDNSRIPGTGGLALNGEATEDNGGGRRSWTLPQGGGNFTLSFSAGASGKAGGRGASGASKKKKNPKRLEQFDGLSASADVRVDVGIFGRTFENVAKAGFEGSAFTPGDNENNLEFKIEVVGQTLYSKRWDRCRIPENKTGKKKSCAEVGRTRPDDLSRFQQNLRWLSRSLSGRYYFSIGPVPMDATWRVNPYVGYAWNIDVEFDFAAFSADIGASFQPGAEAVISLEGGFNVLGQRAGVGGRITLLKITPVAKVGAQANASVDDEFGKFCPYVTADLNYQFLSGNFYAYAQVFYFIGSRRWEFNLFNWNGVQDRWAMLNVRPSACTAPTIPDAPAG